MASLASTAFATCTLIASAAAWAQADVKALEGTWVAQWRAQAGPVATAQLIVRDTGNTWRATFPKNDVPKNACLEREHSARLQPMADGRYRLVVEASKTMAGCQDANATLTLVDSTHLEGQWGNGQVIKLQRR
ncbi:MAG: hypothetical protein U1F56_17705 [Rubrivivax sp.]